jgi:hypothetical protein
VGFNVPMVMTFYGILPTKGKTESEFAKSLERQAKKLGVKSLNYSLQKKAWVVQVEGL